MRTVRGPCSWPHAARSHTDTHNQRKRATESYAHTHSHIERHKSHTPIPNDPAHIRVGRNVVVELGELERTGALVV